MSDAEDISLDTHHFSSAGGRGCMNHTITETIHKPFHKLKY
jgi:hypothetical protein